MAYTVAAAEGCGRLDRIAVSTDSEEVGRVATACSSGATEVLLRDPGLARDTTSTEDVLLDVLDRLALPDDTAVVTLLPTSPFRGAALITRALDLYLEKGAKSVLSVERKRLKTGVLSPDQRYRPSHPYPAEMHRIEPLLLDNPCIYVTQAGALRRDKLVVVDPCYALEINGIEGLDINDPLDWLMAEAVLAAGLFKS